MNRFFFLFSVAAIVAVTAAQFAPGAGVRIGILGAGANGVTTGVMLREMGYTDVTLVDRDSHVGGVADSFLLHGRTYDTATMFVPGASFSGDGVEGTLQRLMAYSGEVFEESVNFNFYDVETGEKSPIPDGVTESDDEVKRQLLEGMVTSIEYVACLQSNPLNTCVDCGVCSSEGESTLAWGARVGLPVYARLIGAVVDGLGANPGILFPAGRTLINPFIAVDAMFALKQLNLRYRDIRSYPRAVRNILVEIYRAPRWFSFQNGYESFWESVVANTGLKTERNSNIESLTRTVTGGWEVEVSHHLDASEPNRVLEFDILIVAAAPADAVNFLPDTAQRNLLSTAAVLSPPNDVFLAEASFGNEEEAESVFSYWPSGLGLGTLGIVTPDPTLPNPFIKPMFWVKRHADRNIVTLATVNINPNAPSNETFAAAKAYAAANLNIELKAQLAHRRYLFPSVSTDPVAWATWPLLQGQNLTFFTGEAFSGSGVPAATFYNNLFWRAVFQTYPGGITAGNIRLRPVVCRTGRDLAIQGFVFAAAAVGVFFAGKKRGERVEKRKSMKMTKELQAHIAEQNKAVESTVTAEDSDFVVTVDNEAGVKRQVSI